MIIATDNKGKSKVIVDIRHAKDWKGIARCLFSSGDKVYHQVPYDAISWVADDTVLKK